MVGPPPEYRSAGAATPAVKQKQDLRENLRRLRREHVAALPNAVRALVFHRPPAPLATLLPEGSSVGLYHATGAEAPTLPYAKWLHDNGRRLALPWFADRQAPMRFARWDNPWDEGELEPGPFGVPQPGADSEAVLPDAVIVPLVGFTGSGERLGQGGGHYDRWLAAHPGTPAIGLAWDCQRLDHLPTETHDHPLRMIVTPTRIFEGA